MCGRFAMGEPDAAAWAEWLGIPPPAPLLPPSWNVAPTQRAMILRAGEGGGRTLMPARWGLVPHWWRKPLAQMKASTFNARAEEAAAKPMFRDAWARGRCLVPALGYYEWTGARGAKTPWFIGRAGNAPGLCFAGLWALARPEGMAEPLLSFAILTCAAGPATASLHPRSPVVLDEAAWDGWLVGQGDPAPLMRPIPDARVRLWQVGPAVGKVGQDGPALIERAGLDL